MSKLKLLLILMLSLTQGCQSTTVPIDTACSWVKPITTSVADRKVMSRQLKEQVAAHNDLYDLRCP
jgi:hypothetical protein